jgi:hypothetical protein
MTRKGYPTANGLSARHVEQRAFSLCRSRAPRTTPCIGHRRSQSGTDRPRLRAASRRGKGEWRAASLHWVKSGAPEQAGAEEVHLPRLPPPPVPRFKVDFLWAGIMEARAAAGVKRQGPPGGCARRSDNTSVSRDSSMSGKSVFRGRHQQTRSALRRIEPSGP